MDHDAFLQWFNEKIDICKIRQTPNEDFRSRADTFFQTMWRLKDRKGQNPLEILQIGCIRRSLAEQDGGDGASTFLWTSFCNEFDQNGRVHSIDINAGNLEREFAVIKEAKLDRYLTQHCGDSINVLRGFRESRAFALDLLYLDSFDCGDRYAAFDAQIHCAQEFKAATNLGDGISLLKNDGMLLLDDADSHFGGKGAMLNSYLSHLPAEWERIHANHGYSAGTSREHRNYQTLWQKR